MLRESDGRAQKGVNRNLGGGREEREKTMLPAGNAHSHHFAVGEGRGCCDEVKRVSKLSRQEEVFGGGRSRTKLKGEGS